VVVDEAAPGWRHNRFAPESYVDLAWRVEASEALLRTAWPR